MNQFQSWQAIALAEKRSKIRRRTLSRIDFMLQVVRVQTAILK